MWVVFVELNSFSKMLLNTSPEFRTRVSNSQVLNAFSRMGASVLTWIPPARAGHFSDQVRTRLHSPRSVPAYVAAV